MTEQLLFSTPHGSRLYGLHHVDSDYDRFEIYGWIKRRGHQKMYGREDVTKTSFDRFLRYCDKGVPQYLEAMFSDMATEDHISYFRAQYVPDLTHVRDTYQRTIKSFWLRGEQENSFKMRRHSARLALNLKSMHETGRFNPTMTPEEIEYANWAAKTLTEPPEAL